MSSLALGKSYAKGFRELMLFSFSAFCIVDFAALDESLVNMFGQVMTSAVAVLSALFLLLAATRWVAVALPFLMAFYKHRYDLYSQGNRELKRVDSTRRSPGFILFSEALTGYWLVIPAETLNVFYLETCFYQLITF